MKLLTAACAFFVSVYSIWMSVEAFIFLMVAQGQILSSGALAVKLGFAAVILLMIQTILSRWMVDEGLKPLLIKKPVIIVGVLLLTFLIFYLSSLVTNHIANILMSINRNDSNVETYLSASIQRTVSLIFPLVLIMVIYFRLFQRNSRFTPRNLSYYLNEPDLLIIFVYGLTWQVIASAARSFLFPYFLISVLVFGLLYVFAAVLVSNKSTKNSGLIISLFHLPGVIIESTGGSTYSVLEELSHYPYGIITIIIAMLIGKILGGYSG